MTIILKVLSGGQNGVDVAALRASKSRGIATGGAMPKGFRTLDGPKPEWAREFGLEEHASDKYPPRTYKNVKDADITIRIAADFTSAGEVCTMNAIMHYGRPHCNVPAWTGEANRAMRVARTFGRYSAWDDHIRAASDEIREVAAALGRPVVVNFAGNSEKTAPGIEAFAEGVVGMILDAVGSHGS